MVPFPFRSLNKNIYAINKDIGIYTKKMLLEVLLTIDNMVRLWVFHFFLSLNDS